MMYWPIMKNSFCDLVQVNRDVRMSSFGELMMTKAMRIDYTYNENGFWFLVGDSGYN